MTAETKTCTSARSRAIVFYSAITSTSGRIEARSGRIEQRRCACSDEDKSHGYGAAMANTNNNNNDGAQEAPTWCALRLLVTAACRLLTGVPCCTRFDEWCGRTPAATRYIIYATLGTSLVGMITGAGILLANCPVSTVFGLQCTSNVEVAIAPCSHPNQPTQCGGCSRRR